jgi:hypothetical protein
MFLPRRQMGVANGLTLGDGVVAAHNAGLILCEVHGGVVAACLSSRPKPRPGRERHVRLPRRQGCWAAHAALFRKPLMIVAKPMGMQPKPKSFGVLEHSYAALEMIE